MKLKDIVLSLFLGLPGCAETLSESVYDYGNRIDCHVPQPTGDCVDSGNTYMITENVCLTEPNTHQGVKSYFVNTTIEDLETFLSAQIIGAENGRLHTTHGTLALNEGEYQGTKGTIILPIQSTNYQGEGERCMQCDMKRNFIPDAPHQGTQARS